MRYITDVEMHIRKTVIKDIIRKLDEKINQDCDCTTHKGYEFCRDFLKMELDEP